MIINTGQRTDIPAFYSKWFINRIREKYVMVRNPYYPSLVTKFKLTPDVVDIIGFCTKNPKPMFEYLDELKDFGQYWHVTITGFDKDLEPNVPPLDERIENFIYLSKRVGVDSIAWRYTPIIINNKYTVQYHIQTFEYIASRLYKHSHLVVFGFLDLYEKLKTNHSELVDCEDENKITISKAFLEIAKKYDMELRLCSKEKRLNQFGIDVNGCMRLEDYEQSIHTKLNVKQKMEARKSYCSCYLSNDIGSYNSCLHSCSYCYANGTKEEVLLNARKHDDNSPLLIGNLNENDTIREAKQESFLTKQITLF